MRKKRLAYRRSFCRALRLISTASFIALFCVSLPVPVGTDAIWLGCETVASLGSTETQNTKVAGCTVEVVPLVHISTIQTVTEPAAEEPTVDETVQEVTEPYYEPLYTDADAIALAKMAWGEALVTHSDTEIAATMWCVLNRFDCDDPYYRNCKTIESIIKQKGAFSGYRASNPVDEHLLWLAYDVLDRWNAEQYGETDVGRVLPPEYLFFHGDGRHNHFRVEYRRNGQYYDWSLESPYES